MGRKRNIREQERAIREREKRTIREQLERERGEIRKRKRRERDERRESN